MCNAQGSREVAVAELLEYLNIHHKDGLFSESKGMATELVSQDFFKSS